MNFSTFSEARKNLATVLDEAQAEGAVRIKRRDGTEFEIAPVRRKKSPLDVQGVDVGLSGGDRVHAPQESRARSSFAARAVKASPFQPRPPTPARSSSVRKAASSAFS